MPVSIGELKIKLAELPVASLMELGWDREREELESEMN